MRQVTHFLKQKTTRFFIFCFLLLLCIQLSACKPNNKLSLPAYIEGEPTYIAANFSGILTALYVTKGQTVKENQRLFVLEYVPEEEDLEAAKARVEEAENSKKTKEASYHLQQSTLQRKLHLYQKDVITKEELEETQAREEQSHAELQAAEQNLVALQANLRKADWAKKQKEIYSPVQAVVQDTFYNVGEFVNAGTPVLSLLESSKIKIIFYIPEKFLSRIKLNDKIKVTCDSCQPILAKIIFISAEQEFTPPIIYSTEERDKFVYRVEAFPLPSKIRMPLHPGQPVTVSFAMT